LLQTLPETAQRLERELTLQLGLGSAFIAIKGWAAPEVGQVFARARDLCRQIGETPHLVQVLAGLSGYYNLSAEMEPSLELAKQELSIAENAEDAALLPHAHLAVGATLYAMGHFTQAQTHLELSYSLYEPARYPSHASPFDDFDIAAHSLGYSSAASWQLGFPEQALDRAKRAVTLARDLAHPFSLCGRSGS
jgi:predicted ATPase